MCVLSLSHTGTHSGKSISDRACGGRGLYAFGVSDASSWEVNISHSLSLGLEDTYGRGRVTYGQTGEGDGEQETRRDAHGQTDEDAAVSLQTWVSELDKHTLTHTQTHTHRGRTGEPWSRTTCGARGLKTLRLCNISWRFFFCWSVSLSSWMLGKHWKFCLDKVSRLWCCSVLCYGFICFETVSVLSVSILEIRTKANETEGCTHFITSLY